MTFVIMLFCAPNVSCGMETPFRGITYYPSPEICVAAAKQNFPFYIRNGDRYAVWCEPVRGEGSPR